MNTPPCPPLTLIESRYWVLNARLLDGNATTEKLRTAVGTFKGNILSGDDLSLDITGHPLDNYSEVTPLLRFRIEQRVVDLLNAKYCEKWKELKLTGLSFYLNDLEILCCYALFSLEPGVDIKTLEEEGMGLVDIISSLQPDLESIFHLLETGKIIGFQSEFVFGVPLPLKKSKLHTPDYSYLFNWHIFFNGNKELLKKTVADYELDQASIPFAGGRVYAGWALLLWDLPEVAGNPEEMIRTIFVDSISGSEAVMYDNSIYCYTGFLDMIIRNEKVDSNDLRQICNISHLALQRIKLWKRNLSVEQQGYLEKLRSVMMLEQKKSDFDSAEETLLKGVEGLEVKQSQKSGRIIELVLSFFTALSLYSVANDFYSIMITDGSVKPMNLFSVRTILIFLATGIVLGFFYLLRKARKA